MEIIIKTKNKITENLLEEVYFLYEKTKNIFADNENVYIQKIEKSLEFIKTLKIETTGADYKDLINLWENYVKIDKLLDIIKSCFEKILDKKTNITTFLSQTYIDETREYNKKINLLFKKIDKDNKHNREQLKIILIDTITKNIKTADIKTEYNKLLDAIKENSIELLCDISNNILEYYTKENNILDAYNILEKIETKKNDIFGKSSKIKYNGLNPFIKGFGLVPVTPLMSINEIINSLFSEQGKTLKDLIKLCKDKEYDLVNIKKIVNRGIEYNTADLLSFNKSKEYEKIQNNDDGITLNTIERYNTISYIAEKQDKWNITYDYLNKNDNNKFAIILNEYNDNKFCIMMNQLNTEQKFIRKSNVIELLDFVNNQSYSSSRVNNYNNIINSSIVENMFLSVKPDLENLKIKSYVIDPKYLRNEIYLMIFSKFKTMIRKTAPKSIYEFSKLIHDELFEELFVQIIMNEYYKYLFKNTSIYETENISMAEMYSSFLYTINIYARDFTKKIHDDFLSNSINEIKAKKDLFKDKENAIDELTTIYDNLLKNVLSAIITNENNIFQSLIYKLYLFKLSMLD